MKTVESNTQIACVRAFRLLFPALRLRLFSIPNGGQRSKITAVMMQREGALSGVPDLFLAVPSKTYSGLFIEMKSKTGRLTENQTAFIRNVQQDYKCVVCRSVDEFLNEINNYLK